MTSTAILGTPATTMRALVCRSYGPPDVLRFEQIERPRATGSQVLVRPVAVSLNAADWRLLSADIVLVRLAMGLFKPKLPVLGAAVAGRVEAVGPDVKNFAPGDEVLGDVSGDGFGGLAEVVRAKESVWIPKPKSISFETAAAIPLASVTALQALRTRGQVQPGQSVLIYGSAGGVGIFAVQLAKLLGADVTAACRGDKADFVRTLGADRVVDYTQDDPTAHGPIYDLIVANGGDRRLSEYRRALKPRGRWVGVGGSQKQLLHGMILAPLVSLAGGHKLGFFTATPDASDLRFVTDAVEAKKIAVPIDRTYPFEQAVEAFRHLGGGNVRGKIVIRMDG